MNLQSAKALSELRTPQHTKVEPKVKTALQVAKRVHKLAAQGGFPYKKTTPAKWAKKWLASKEFVLMEIPINAAASPCKPKSSARVAHYLSCSVESLDPIVVDLNKRKVGKTSSGFIPEVVVHDGKHRKQAQIMNGRLTIMAWVGRRAVKKIKLDKITKTINASSNGNGHVKVYPSSITSNVSSLQLYAGVAPSMNIPSSAKSDMGEGGGLSVGKVQGKKVKAGGPGSGRKPEVGHYVKVRKEYGGQRGVVTGKAPSGEWSIVKHKDGTSASYHDSDLTVLRNGEKQELSDRDRGWMNAGGPGSGRHPDEVQKEYREKVERGDLKPGDKEKYQREYRNAMQEHGLHAGKDCRACGARSSGSLESTPDPSDAKIPPDQSDASQAVDASDRLKFNPKKANVYAPGTGPGYTDQFGSPNFQAPGAGSGPRVANKGASNSEFARSMKFAMKKDKKGKIVPKMWNDKRKRWMDAVAPPGREEQVLKLKEKYGEKSATPFKIAWSQYKDSEGKHTEA